MAFPQQENAALSPNSLFDDSPSPEPQPSYETMQNAASTQGHPNPNPALSQPFFLNFPPRFSIPPNIPRTSDPRSSRNANRRSDFQSMSNDDFFAKDFNPYAHPAPGPSNPQGDAYLDLHAQNFGHLDQGHTTWDANLAVSGTFPFPQAGTGTSQPSYGYPNPTPAAPDLRPPSRSQSILSISSSIQAVKSAIKSTVKSKGRRKKRPPPDSEDDHSDHRKTKTKKVITEEGCTVDAAKQRRCRQKKADNQEALEAEVQKLRAILENLGGCVEGVQVERRNWQ